MADGPHRTDDLINATIAGRYRIISRLGAGGMGVAYRAWDEQGGVPVVIKIPKRVFLEDPKFVERFSRETRLLQGLDHAHIVPIVDVGEHDGLPYVVLRFLPGGSLSNRRLRDAEGKPTPNPAGMLHLWLPAIAAALDHVHSQGVVHRDVKPANIFFDAFWGAYLGDFGIAKIVEESDAFDREQTLTATHMGIGTQEYMSPEQFTPKATIDGRADQYALAVTVYELLAGHRPFTGKKAHLIVEVTTQPVPPLEAKRPDLPATLVAAVYKGLAKKPADRFESCAAFVKAVLRDVPALIDDPGVARLLCPQCSNMLKLPVAAAGQKGKCPRCRTKMKVADDLGALWLLDEDLRQRQLDSGVASGQVLAGEELGPAPDSVPHPELVSADIEGEGGVEGIEAFKPVSSTTPIGRSIRRRSRVSPVAVSCGVAAVAAVLGWFLLGDGTNPVEQVQQWLRKTNVAVRQRDPWAQLKVKTEEAMEDLASDVASAPREGVDVATPSKPRPVGRRDRQEATTPQPAVQEAVAEPAAEQPVDTALPAVVQARPSVVVESQQPAEPQPPADPAKPSATADTAKAEEQPAPSPLDTLAKPEPDDEPSPKPDRKKKTRSKGGPFDGRRKPAELAAEAGGGADTEQAVDRALEWLANHQMTDGGWSFDLDLCPACGGRCKDSGESHLADRCAATALAILPFLGRGYTHKQGPYQRQIDGGLTFLSALAVNGNGKLYQKGNLYSQGVAAIALAEAYAMTGDRRLLIPAQLAINFIMEAQDPHGGGWRYEPQQPGDTSASGWQLMALSTAYAAKLQVNPLTIKKAAGFLDSVQSGKGAMYGYTEAGKGPATTAVGLICRMHLGWNKDHPAVQHGVAHLATIGPTDDLYYDYYATQVMFQHGGDPWLQWNDVMKAMLLQNQSQAGHEAGSFFDGVAGGHGPHAAGRLYCTAMAALILEVYYRHPLLNQ